MAGFLTVFLTFALATPDTFLTNRSFSSILNSQAVPGIVAIGITLLMISGEFDLSVGSILGVSSLVFLHTAVQGLHILLAVLLGLLTGCLLGLLNGLLLVWTGIPSFIVTLGTMLVYRGISLTAISGGRIIRYADHSRRPPLIHLPPLLIAAAGAGLFILVLWTARTALQKRLKQLRQTPNLQARFRPAGAALALLALLGLTAVLGLQAVLTLGSGHPVEVGLFHLLNGRSEAGIFGGNYRTSILWWLALSVLFTVILTRTRTGNAVFATGGNAEAARLQGININRVRVTNFVLSGGLAALAGIVQVARLKSVDPLRGAGMELEVIAAVVIGGTLLTGGYGSILGSAIGTALTGMLRTGLVLIHVPSNAFRGAIGAIMIAAVVINTLVRKER